MKNLSNFFLLICILLQCLHPSKTYASITYDWTGAVNTDWGTPGNWKVGSTAQTTNYPGTATTDIAQIGVANTFTRQPTISNPIAITTLNIGTLTAATLTVNSTLAVSGDITQQHNGNTGGITTGLTGSGSITCNNFYLGNNTTPPTPLLGLANVTNQTILNFSLAGPSTIQNLILTTTSSSAVLNLLYSTANVNNPTFNFNSGTITIGNAIQTVDPNDANLAAINVLLVINVSAVSSSAQFLMQPTTGNTTVLNLNGANALSLDGHAGFIDLYCTCGGIATVNYGGTGNQEVYTSTTPYSTTSRYSSASTGLDQSPKIYPNLIFSGALTKKADGGNLTIANNLTLTASSTETVDFATNSPIVTVGGNFVSNTGTTLNQGGTGTMTITGTSNNAGTLNQTGSGNITFTGALNNSLTSAIIAQTGSGSIIASAGITNSGSISQGSGTIGSITVATALTNTGTITQTSGNIIVNGNLTNSGGLNLGSANLNISGNYTNSGTYAQNTGTTLFNGTSAQTLQGGSGAGTPFNTVNFSGSGAKSMTSGNFSVSSTSVLTMIGSSSLAAGGFLTLKSDTSGSATVAALPSGASITGNVNVQRFLTGGTNKRGYRLLSSPVTQGSGIYSINYLINSIYVLGTTGATGGFDKVGNPTVYLYRENLIPDNTSFLTGNYRGINNILASPSYTMDIDGGPFNIPVGNGYLCFFRGDRNVASITAETVSTYIPTNTTLTTTGTLNAGSIAVVDWFTPASPYLSFTASSPAGISGYNLVGNPYASAIDWDKFQTSSTTTGIYGTTNVSNTIYELDAVTKTYGSYIAGSGGVGSATFVSNIIASGQGFFVIAKSANAKLIFNESAKTNSQNIGPKLEMTTNMNYVINQYLRLQMGQDSIRNEQTLIRFDDRSSLAYTSTVDAPYKPGFGTVSLSTLSSDNIDLSINTIPLPKQQSETIRLNINAGNNGTYNMTLQDIVAIPQLYDVWLMDAYKRDSLNMRLSKSYSFDVNKADSASFGSTRFTLVIRQNAAYAYQLLNFTASKVSTARQVEVSWNTENEANYTNFTVERSTDNGKSFDVLATVSADGQGNYSFLDKSPLIGSNLYKLKQVDINNNVSYSKIVTIQYANLSNNLAGNKVSIYPNPVSSTINLAINTDNTGTAIYNIKFMSSTGMVVKEITSAQPSWQGSINNLQPGTYVIRVINNTTQNLVGENKFVKL